MYLTRIELDVTKRKTQMALASHNMFHGAIERAFPERKRKLWRVDKVSGKTYLLLVSEDIPMLDDFSEQFGAEKGWETQNYDIFIGNIRNGDRRRFRLCANPVITKSAGSGARGEVLAHVSEKYQEKWLLERAKKNGFVIVPGEFSVVQSEWVTFRKGNDNARKVSFKSVMFEGTLTVCDEELFRNALVNGVGKEKAYGCGLMTVTRAL